MRAIKLLIFIFLIYNPVQGQDAFIARKEEETKTIKLCGTANSCTCSEIGDVDENGFVFNIQCSELDRIEISPDLDKIQWPENPNGLKISAAFEGLGLSILGKLPPNPQVASLRFSNNVITTYWPDPFSDVPNLKNLSFSQNQLSKITPDLFTNIEGLEELDLSYNNLTTINVLDFKSLRNVKRLNLQGNQLNTVPMNALEHMTALEDLDLSENGIFDLLLQRTDGDALKGVKRLSLSGNKIRSVIMDSFPVNNSIELLDLSNNAIEIVETDAFLTCVNLRELNIAQNNITLIFALPPSLQIAIMKINTLYHWPQFPAGIMYVDLSYNKLSEIYDENKMSFDNLEILYVAWNQIKQLTIKKKLPKLYRLDLSYNLISDIPQELNSQILPSLEELRLDGNLIESIYFKNIISLKSLYMNDLSKLEVVDGKSFSNVVGRAADETNEVGCFSLSLSNCRSLREIRDGAFDGTSLCMLDISSNNLTLISENLLNWNSLEGVNLQYNPWHCSCELQWILDELLPQMYRRNSLFLSELRCGSPRAVEGLRLVHWYNWTERAMCGDIYLRSGPRGTYLLESTEQGSKVSSITLILAASIIVSLLVAIVLFVYLIKSRKRYRIRQAALNRKRQNAADAKDSNGLEKEQFSSFNKS